MGKAFISNCRVVVGCILLTGLLLAGPAVSWAADTVCARVKIEIKQELTLERQAFDAHMRINNGLSNISLEQVNVDVSFADQDGNTVVASTDPEDTDALFFIRLDLDAMENIDNVSGTGTVNPSTSADIHWLIIPAPGSSNGLESGTLYYVGAKLTYTIGGEEKVTAVTPDYIFVKPMPEITLDYFLPSDVYGDDPLTEGTVEPIVPFSLGVRVKNSGHGVARKLKIESAQPKITENDQGLLIGFAIEGSEVNGQPEGDSLLVDFGDIPANSSAMARWIMTCTLSGKFISFTADFSHSDELGGELTSLIQAVNTHFLVRDVIVDLPGRDAVGDFLARDGSVYRIYESEVTGLADPADGDPEVADQSPTAVLSGTGDTRTLTTAVTAGYMYVQLADPFGGQQVIKEVVRSDGKIIKPANAWLSHTRVKDNPWQYHLNLFDVNSTGTYIIKFEDTSAVPMPPVMQLIVDKTVAEGEQVSFIVEASDTNGTMPQLSGAPLPVGAEFKDEGQGLGVFDWTPGTGQAGIYGIVFTASDGALMASRRATITVTGFRDTDGDGLDDDWEIEHFGTLARDGSGDFDHDGISDLDEFLYETDPGALADVAVRLTADNMIPIVGDTVILTITATNNGLRSATGVQVTNLMSAGLAYDIPDSDPDYQHATGVWDIPALEPNATATLDITAKVTRSGKILNIAVLTDADLYDPDRSNNSAALILNGGIQSDLALAQTIDNPRPESGETIAVNLTVTNNGIDDATGVQISYVLPVGLNHENSPASQGDYVLATETWNVGDLAAGAGATLYLTLTPDNTDEIINTAAISHSDQPDPDPTNNRSSIVINQDLDDHPYIADLSIHKRVNHSAVDVGGQAIFTLIVRNNGPDEASNVKIDDLLPEGLALQSAIPSQGSYDDTSKLWLVGTLPTGGLAELDMIVAVTEAGDQDNTADIDSLVEFDPDISNDFDNRSVTGLAADIAVTQIVDKPTANVGENFEFTITVTNNGPYDATGVVVVHEVPAGMVYLLDEPFQGVFGSATGQWDIGDLAKGSTVTLKITYQVDAAGQMINKAGLQSSSPTDTDGTNNEALVTVAGNTSPVVSDIPDQTIDEGELFLTIDLDDYVEDADNADAEMDWTYSGDIELSVDIDDGTHVASITIPHPDWYGSETIIFKATDPTQLSDSNAAVFTIRNVNDRPVAMVDTYDVDEELILTIPAPGVLGNDSDIDSNNVTALLVEDVKSGTLILSSDGSFSYEPNGNFHGNDSFSYNVNDGLDDSSVVTVTIVVNPVNDTPIANAGGPYASDEGTFIAFDASPSSDIDNDELRYRWDFNSDGLWDTEYSTEPIATYTWYDNYTGTVIVEAWDGNLIDTATVSVTVADVSPAVSIAGAGNVNEGAEYILALSAVDPGDDTITSWTINWGDEVVETVSGNPDTATHRYADDKDYTITASATNEDGTYDAAAAVAVAVADVAPIVSISGAGNVDEGAEYSLSLSAIDPGTDTVGNWTINWGDGSDEILNGNPGAATHTYADNGGYTISASATNEDGTYDAEATVTVAVADVPPIVSISGPAGVNEGAEYSLSLSAIDPGTDTIQSWAINWGDGSDETLADNPVAATHTYADNGGYTISASATNEDGTYDAEAAVAVAVADVAPTVIISGAANVDEGAEYSLSLSAIDPGTDTIQSWAINWGDGVEETLELSLGIAKHRYADDGEYTISATATNEDGTYDAEAPVTVSVADVAPHIALLTHPASSDEGLPVGLASTITDPGQDGHTLTRVDWGDGTVDDNPTAAAHTYADDGTYEIIASFTEDDTEATIRTASITHSVSDVAPTVSISGASNVNEGAAYSLLLSAVDPGDDTITSWSINWGDGVEETLELSLGIANHRYADDGEYTISATATNEDGTYDAEAPVTVSVADVAPHIALLAHPASSDEGLPVGLASTITDPGQDGHTLTRVDWGDGTVDDNPTAAAHTYADDGTYEIIASFTEDDTEATIRTASITHSVSDVAPTVSISGASNVNEGAAYSLLLSAVDPGDDTITSWSINWGDGVEETLELSLGIANHRYADDGEYTISATATNEDGTYDAEAPVTVSVADVAPHIALLTHPASSDEGLPVGLASTITDPGQDGHTLTRVDWGDGTVDDNPTAAAHTYADDGTYEIIASFTEDDTEATIRTASITHSVSDVAPTVSISGASNVNEGAAYSLLLSAVDPGDDTITSWSINWGDGVEETLELSLGIANHRYADDGEYTISATATNEDGTYDAEAPVTVSVADVAPHIALLTHPASSDEGLPVGLASTITDPGQDGHTLTRVDWGDGTVEDNPTAATHTYADNGTYEIIASFTEDDTEATIRTASITYSVSDVAPTVSISGASNVNEGAAYSLLLSAVDPGDDTITSWSINWGDGVEETLELSLGIANHRYADDGEYTISATATNEDGTYDAEAPVTVSVADVAPHIALLTHPASSDEGLPVGLASTITDPGQDGHTLTRVDWGDGTVDDNPTAAAHTYADDGTYEIIASFTEDDTEATIRTASITHSVSDVAPTVSISGASNVNEGAEYSLSLSAIDPGTDTIQSWAINWGDGSDETLADNPVAATHTYADNGGYTISASATNEDGTYDAEVNILVTVNNVSPAVGAGNDAAIDEGDTFSSTGSFTDPGADEWAATVDYGDGSGEQFLALNPDKSFVLSHLYTENGSYPVTVTISDDDGESGSDTVVVTVNNVAPTATAGEDQLVDEGDLVFFSGGFTDPGADTYTIEWEFGDGASESGTLTPSHSYGDNGTYTVTVTVTDDDGGTGTGTLTVVVDNTAPVLSGLTSDSPSNGEIELAAAFADAGWLDTHTDVWDFGDGTVAGAQIAAEHEKPEATGTLTAVHNYAAEGLFRVSVTVTDDDGAGSTSKPIEVLIDKTAPVIEVYEPQAGYYRNTEEIMVDVAVYDPESGGVSSGLVATSVNVTLDGLPIAADELLDLSEMADGFHTLYVSASDYAGNSTDREVRFEVGPVPALVHIQPHNWELQWLDPFDNQDSLDSKDAVKAEISLENAEVETIIPTDNAAKLKAGNGYGDFVVVDVVADESSEKHDKGNVVSLTLKYVGIDEMDILAFSGDTVQDFYSINAGDTIAIESGPAGYLDHHTVLSSYQSDPPLLSAADIIPETVLLNQWVPIIEGSARLITKDAADLAQSGVIAEPPYGVVKEKKHHVWLANVGQPQQMTLEVGSQTIFADEPYPVNWQDWFSLDNDGRLQMMRIHVSKKDNLLQVLHHNLQAEARIYLDGALALTILPEKNLIAMEVLFNRFDVMSTIDKQIILRGGDWLVTAHNGAALEGKHPRKHISVSDIGYPQKAKLVIGDTVVFDDQPFPINWSERYLIVDGQRQDLSIKTKGAHGNSPHLSINCKQLTHEARLYLDDLLILVISPPPEVGVSITGALELDGDPATFDGSFRGSDAIELKGKLPKDFDPPMSYQRINTSGEPALQIGNRNGDFEVVNFTEEYEDYSVTELSLNYNGAIGTEINVYEDARRKHLIAQYPVSPGDYFELDVSYLDNKKVYLKIGKKHDDISLTGKKAVEIGDSFLDCTVTDITKIPLGPPHYVDLTLEYAGAIDAIALTAYDGKPKNVIGAYQVDSDSNPVFTIDGSQMKKGHIGENLVLEYAPD